MYSPFVSSTIDALIGQVKPLSANNYWNGTATPTTPAGAMQSGSATWEGRFSPRASWRLWRDRYSLELLSYTPKKIGNSELMRENSANYDKSY